MKDLEELAYMCLVNGFVGGLQNLRVVIGWPCHILAGTVTVDLTQLKRQDSSLLALCKVRGFKD